MNRLRFLQTLTLAMITIALASSAYAQADRTWVSGVGDDANPCSRTAPCKTWAGAISKTAAGGEIDALDPGGFGAVTITKAVTLDGGGGQIAGVLVAGTNGIVIQAGNNDVVTLRNLDIDGIGGQGLNGVRILSGKGVHIHHCQIYGFSARGIDDVRTTPAAPQLFVDDCLIGANGQGIAVTGVSASATRAFIDNCRIEDNSGFGIGASNHNVVTVRNSQVVGNGAEGVRIDTSAQAVVVSSVINVNQTGALNSGGIAFTLNGCTLINNITGVSGTITTFGNNAVTNNIGGNTVGSVPLALQ